MDFDAAIRLDPTNPDAYVGRVNAYGAIGQLNRVIADCYHGRALAYQALGEHAKAAADEARAREENRQGQTD